MGVEEHRSTAGRPVLGFALLTVSDSRDEKSDKGGPLLASLVTAAGHRVVVRAIVKDEVAAIRDQVASFFEMEQVEALLVTGGTGLAPRDVTIEAIPPLFEKEIPGFGELFRMLSFQEIGAAAMLSRATAGLASGRVVFLLPGSPKALDLALTRLVLPELPHLLAHARKPGAVRR